MTSACISKNINLISIAEYYYGKRWKYILLPCLDVSMVCWSAANCMTLWKLFAGDAVTEVVGGFRLTVTPLRPISLI